MGVVREEAEQKTTNTLSLNYNAYVNMLTFELVHFSAIDFQWNLQLKCTQENDK